MKHFLQRSLTEKYLRWFWLGGFLLVGISIQSLGQGCSQCLDSTRATPPAVQAAYRHAIILLGSAGASLFIAGTLLFRRTR
jgi:hypothetical protein